MLTSKDEVTAATLDEPFRSKALRCFFLVQRHFENDPQIDVVLRDGWRDPIEQQRLFEVGRTQLEDGSWKVTGKIRTNARAHVGPHCYRRAVHIILLDLLAKSRWLADLDKRWNMIEEYANQCGLVCLGSNPTLQDKAHIESAAWRQFARDVRNWKPMGKDERIDG